MTQLVDRKTGGVKVATADGSGKHVKAVHDNSGGTIVFWTEGYRAGISGGELLKIYAQHIETSGEILWEIDGITVFSGVDV